MTVLSDYDLHRRLAPGAEQRLIVEPLGTGAVQPSSIDLRLGPDLLIATPDGYRPHSLTNDGPLRLFQHAFILGATLEWIEVPDDLVGVLVGKSSRAREGLQVEAAGFVDPGWRGNLTLEIVMLSPFPTFLMAGEMIAQLHVQLLLSRCDRPYGSDGVGRYQNSTGPVESRAVIGRAS